MFIYSVISNSFIDSNTAVYGARLQRCLVVDNIILYYCRFETGNTILCGQKVKTDEHIIMLVVPRKHFSKIV